MDEQRPAPPYKPTLPILNKDGTVSQAPIDDGFDGRLDEFRKLIARFAPKNEDGEWGK